MIVQRLAWAVTVGLVSCFVSAPAYADNSAVVPPSAKSATVKPEAPQASLKAGPKPLLARPMTPTPPPFAGLSFVAQDGISLPAQNEVRCDIGAVNALNIPQITRTFTIKNIASGALTIDRLQPSCSCTAAKLVPPAGTLAPTQGLVTLAAGQTAQVEVSVNLQILPPGAVDKTVSVYLAGNSQPVALIEILGNLVASVTLTPSLLDFGRVTSGQAHTLVITAKIDHRLAPDGKVPSLISSSQILQIGEQPLVIVRAAGGAGTHIPAKGRTWVRRGNTSVEVDPPAGDTRMLTKTYMVTVPKNAPLGPLDATLLFAQPSSAGASKTAVAGANAWGKVSVLVVAQVAGDVSSQPQRLAFGTVQLGQAAARQILLTETKAGALNDARVMAASPWLTAQIVTADSSVNPFTQPSRSSGLDNAYHVLRVALSPQTPLGALDSQIKLMLHNGQQLIIPVTAYVRAGD